MVDTTVFILHYSDDKIHPTFRRTHEVYLSNLLFNEFLLRCVQSIKRNTTYPHKLVIVDNGSPEVAHEDAVKLLKEHGLTPEFLWVQEDWHPVAVGANRAMDALETDYMAFITSDMKPGKNWLQHMVTPLKEDRWHMTACEPNITLYGIGEPARYRTPALWEIVRRKDDPDPFIRRSAEAVYEYFDLNGVDVEMDDWGEPVPECRQFIKEGNERISIFTASRDFIDKVGRYDEKYLRACEYQYFFQALKRGIENPTSDASYTYISHYGGLFRMGIGAYGGEDIKKYAPEGDLRYQRGAGNVFAVKDEIVFRKNKEGKYEIFRKETNQILHTEQDLSTALSKWEEIAK